MLFEEIEVINNIPNTVVDGVDIINLFEPKTELGNLLSPFHVGKGVEFMKWNFHSVKSLMDFLRLENYDPEWLTIKNHNKNLKDKIKKLNKKECGSYWGIISLFLINKAKVNKKLVKLIKDNTLTYNMYYEEEKSLALFNSSFRVKKKIKSFHGYCKSVSLLDYIIKNNLLDNDEKLKSLIKNSFPNIEEDIQKILV